MSQKLAKPKERVFCRKKWQKLRQNAITGLVTPGFDFFGQANLLPKRKTPDRLKCGA